MQTTRTFLLEKPAGKGGGDKYKEMDTPERTILGTIYIDQFYSRAGSGKPADHIEITVKISKE